MLTTLYQKTTIMKMLKRIKEDIDPITLKKEMKMLLYYFIVWFIIYTIYTFTV